MRASIRLATANAHKVSEMRVCIQSLLGFDVKIIPQNISVLESGATFEENARLKAMAARTEPNCIVIADDSGLCVDALDGAPGIFSARFHEKSSLALGGSIDAKNRISVAHALRERGVSSSKAHFVCAIHVIGQLDSKTLDFCKSATLHGWVHADERGQGGFGYDSMFSLSKDSQRIAEMSPNEKLAISHRSHALKAAIEFIKQNL